MKKKLHKLDESLRHPAGSSAVDRLCEETAAINKEEEEKEKNPARDQKKVSFKIKRTL